MTTAEMFTHFIDNLAISNDEIISTRYGEVTASLNKKFRDTESKTANSLQVGSFGRYTGIDGISDLDMLYLMPKSLWPDYQFGGQRKLLEDTKSAILKRYPTTSVRVDRLVVTVTYSDFHIEVQPVFEEEDGSFKYPDTKGDGSWKITKPRDEIEAISTVDKDKNLNLRRLCKMARAWKNKHGVAMGGLLIDTLAHNFLKSTNDYDSKSFKHYDALSRDFFKYLSEEPEKDRYAALGSGQHVKVKKKFQRKAKKAYNLCLSAIDAGESKGANDKWKKVFGRPFPAYVEATNEAQSTQKSDFTFRQTEQFIEDLFPIDIRYDLRIDCEVSQKGFRNHYLRDMLTNQLPLLARKQLVFRLIQTDVPHPFEIKWKVLNRGYEAEKRDCVRGQIVSSDQSFEKHESTTFKGDHIVECYAIKNGVVVAKDRIHVPITSNAEILTTI